VINEVFFNTNVLGVDTTIVIVFEVVCDMDAARNGTMESKLSFHLVSSLDVVVITDIVNSISNTPTVLKS
jgi:hypothetical protein